MTITIARQTHSTYSLRRVRAVLFTRRQKQKHRAAARYRPSRMALPSWSDIAGNIVESATALSKNNSRLVSVASRKTVFRQYFYPHGKQCACPVNGLGGRNIAAASGAGAGRCSRDTQPRQLHVSFFIVAARALIDIGRCNDNLFSAPLRNTRRYTIKGFKSLCTCSI